MRRGRRLSGGHHLWLRLQPRDHLPAQLAQRSHLTPALPRNRIGIAADAAVAGRRNDHLRKFTRARLDQADRNR
jgi:hypothetical protein